MNKNPQTSSSSSRKTIQSLLFTRRGGFAALLVIAVLAMAFAAISISSAQSSDVQQPNAQGQALPAATPATQSPTVPLLTMQNAPETPQCRGILRQEILDVANRASEDPAVTFERNRRAHPHMIMMPPHLECASSLWKAARRGGAPESPAGTENY